VPPIRSAQRYHQEEQRRQVDEEGEEHRLGVPDDLTLHLPDDADGEDHEYRYLQAEVELVQEQYVDHVMSIVSASGISMNHCR
jgi:hypothetical protein